MPADSLIITTLYSSGLYCPPNVPDWLMLYATTCLHLNLPFSITTLSSDSLNLTVIHLTTSISCSLELMVFVPSPWLETET